MTQTHIRTGDALARLSEGRPRPRFLAFYIPRPAAVPEGRRPVPRMARAIACRASAVKDYARRVAARDDGDGAALYITAAEPAPHIWRHLRTNGWARKPLADAIAGSRWAWADVDPPEHAAPGTPEHAVWRRETAAALRALEHPPTLLMVSGTGVWTLYHLSEWADATTLEGVNLWLSGRLLAAGVPAVDGCHNADRLMRMPGSVNHRSGRVCRVYEWSDTTLDDIGELAAAGLAAAAARVPAAARPRPRLGAWTLPARWARALAHPCLDYGDAHSLHPPVGLRGEYHGDRSRSALLARVVAVGHAAGHDEDAIAAAVLDTEFGRGYLTTLTRPPEDTIRRAYISAAALRR